MIFGSLHRRPGEGQLRVPHSTGLLRWVLCQLLPAWLCLVLGWVAPVAAAPDEQAPMCDPHGASVAAPVEVPEVDRGKLEELSCDALLRWVGSGIDFSEHEGPALTREGAPRPPAELQLERERPEGVIELSVLLPARSEPDRLLDSECSGLPPRQGHRLPVFRPPVPAC